MQKLTTIGFLDQALAVIGKTAADLVGADYQAKPGDGIVCKSDEGKVLIEEGGAVAHGVLRPFFLDPGIPPLWDAAMPAGDGSPGTWTMRGYQKDGDVIEVMVNEGSATVPQRASIIYKSLGSEDAAMDWVAQSVMLRFGDGGAA